MKTILEYSQNNVMLIPHALYAMSDVDPLMFDGNSGVFYKVLKYDLVDVEFFTNIPCLIYVETGCEIITTSDNKVFELSAGKAFFLPQGISFHSDFVNTTGNLKAYLVFFSDDVITRFIGSKKVKEVNKNNQYKQLEIQCDRQIEVYFHSLQLFKKRGYNSSEILKVKLLELLHLLSLYDEDVLFSVLQSKKTHKSTKRNLMRLLSEDNIFRLTVNDLASLSGKSLSTFTRDFKALYDIPPKQWLQSKRLARGNELLLNTELTVTHIAADLGYENVSHFIKSFKDKYKITPKQFKQIN